MASAGSAVGLWPNQCDVMALHVRRVHGAGLRGAPDVADINRVQLDTP